MVLLGLGICIAMMKASQINGGLKPTAHDRYIISRVEMLEHNISITNIKLDLTLILHKLEGRNVRKDESI
jgi:hypothetical protein